MSTEKEFGFIITQGLTRKMTKAKVADKITGFLSDRKNALMKTLKLPENRIHTGCYYDRDTREYNLNFSETVYLQDFGSEFHIVEESLDLFRDLVEDSRTITRHSDFDFLQKGQCGGDCIFGRQQVVFTQSILQKRV